MKIGKIRLKNNLVLAPMAGITNLPYRLLCKDAGLRCTEMINVNALARNNKATERMCLTCKDERPVSFQLFGLRDDPIKKAVERIEGDIIDFNFGCPAHQIVGSGSGAALLKRPEKIGKIISTLVGCTSKPVTAKIRLGYDKNNLVKIAKVVEDAGASAIAVHARTYKQGFSGKADWKALEKLDLSIPVIGNGDVVDGVSAKELLKVCNGVMIGRGALGDPGIFTRVWDYLDTGKVSKEPKKKEKVGLFLEYYENCKKYGLLDVHNLKMRAQDFTKSLKGSRIIRQELNKIKDVDILVKYMRGLK